MWYAKSVSDVLSEFHVDPHQGLSEEEIIKRQNEYGLNKLPESKKESLLSKFLHQFTDILVLVLIGATIISFILGERLDAIVIFCIVILNGILGFIQEYKAEKSLEALQKMSAQYALIIRNGEKRKIRVEEVVPGDLIILNAGDKVPADARIIEEFNITVQEAILTGESLSVDKVMEPMPEKEIAIGDQRNMLFKDTIVASGYGQAIVIATGVHTQVGKISQLLMSQEEQDTPLQIELDKVGKRLSLAAGVIVVIVFATGILVHALSLVEMFLTSVALAVAAIPEGLPAVVTIVLSLGVSRMAKQRAIVKKLPAVETLGATSIICSDKTGTLTQNKIRVASIVLADHEGDIPSFTQLQSKPDQLHYFLLNSIVNSEAALNKKENGSYEEVGDQTEVALLYAAQELGQNIEQERNQYEMLYQIPFDSERKYMVVISQSKNDNDAQFFVLMKGAPEVVLKHATMNDTQSTFWQEKIESMAHKGLRTLGFAYKIVDKNNLERFKTDEDALVADLTFTGLVGERDPLRPEVIPAVKSAQDAGIRTVMITGDHKLTALSIAKELGLADDEGDVMTGEELSGITDDDLLKRLDTLSVFARVNPEQKLRLVKLYQQKYNAKVAVTGDGVNDAPAIKAADIGIAMGIEGTDVTREVADLVLEDDNYATIVTAVREGRIIFENLIKFIRYLISCNISEIFVVFFAILLGYPSPLLPIQLLWVNLVTDGLPALALGMDSAEADVMQRPPRDIRSGILTTHRWFHMAIEGIIIGIATLTAFILIDKQYGDAIARTVAFTTLSLSQLVHAVNNRSEHFSVFNLSFFSNKALIWTIVGSFILQMLVIYTVIGNTLFEAVPLPPSILLLTLMFALLPLVYVETRKLIGNLRAATIHS